MPLPRETTPFTTPPTLDMTSPRALGSGAQNFAIHSQDAETIRSSLRMELAAHIIEDQKAVSGRLGLGLVSEQLVDDCSTQLLCAKKQDIEKLQSIVSRAESKGDNAKEDGAFETHMYKPLVCSFCLIYASFIVDDAQNNFRSALSSISRPSERPNRKDGGFTPKHA